jgi:hypothetical protein
MTALVPRRLWAPLLAALFASLVWAGTADAYIYWAGGTRIARANNDGTGANYEFITPAGTFFACGIAVDSGHVYWGNTGGSVGRANLDGTGVESDFIEDAGGEVCGVAVTASHIYWTDQKKGKVGRANLDGKEADGSWAAAADACGIAAGGDTVYLTTVSGAGAELVEMNGTLPKGTVIEHIPAGEGRCGVAADDSNVYWSHQGANGPSTELLVGRARVDGFSLPEPFFIGAGSAVTPSVISSVAIHDGEAYYAPYNGPIGRSVTDRTSQPESNFLPIAPTGTTGEIIGIAVDDGPLPTPPAEPSGPGGGSGGSGSSGGGSGTSTPPASKPPVAPAKPKPKLLCKKGTHRKVVKGKARCVKPKRHKKHHRPHRKH